MYAYHVFILQNTSFARAAFGELKHSARFPSCIVAQSVSVSEQKPWTSVDVRLKYRNCMFSTIDVPRWLSAGLRWWQANSWLGRCPRSILACWLAITSCPSCSLGQRHMLWRSRPEDTVLYCCACLNNDSIQRRHRSPSFVTDRSCKMKCPTKALTRLVQTRTTCLPETDA